jgi:hypothetical protein
MHSVILMLVVFVSLVSGCESSRADRWRGFAYPDRSDLRRSTELGEFDSLDACRSAASIALQKYSNGDYECGRNCRFEEKYAMHVCEETLH